MKNQSVMIVRGVGCGCIVAAHVANYPIDHDSALEFIEHVRVDGFEIARVAGPVGLSGPCDNCRPPNRKVRP